MGLAYSNPAMSLVNKRMLNSFYNIVKLSQCVITPEFRELSALRIMIVMTAHNDSRGYIKVGSGIHEPVHGRPPSWIVVMSDQI